MAPNCSIQAGRRRDRLSHGKCLVMGTMAICESVAETARGRAPSTSQREKRSHQLTFGVSFSFF